MSDASLFEPITPHAPRHDRYVHVAVERALTGAASGRAADDALTYADPFADLEPGERVEVPLGKGDSHAFGVVVRAGGRELAGGLAPERIKAVRRRLGARLPKTLVELGVWIADYYACPIGLVFGSMVPAPVKRAVGAATATLVDVAPGAREASPKLTKSVMAAWRGVLAIDPGAFPMDAGALQERLDATTRRAINALLRAGVLREVEVGLVRARRGIDTLGTDAYSATPLDLTRAQRVAAEGIGATLGAFSAHLLRGVTGSGKTEVYLWLIERVLGAGRRAIVLVPEIALTPQAASRYTARFGRARVAVLHSGLTGSQRHAEWDRARRGEAGVVVGARSAIFAPLEDLGLIVVDEEHDGSYKQDQAPRYHARDAAVVRATLERCPVVLGSATPSLESWSNATGPAPKYRSWTLGERAGGGAMPRVEVVDVIAERRARAREEGGHEQRLLGHTLATAIGEALDAGGQVMLLLNRRGFASHIRCPSASCGFVLMCDQCAASLVYHRDPRLPLGGAVKCHHCLGEQILPRLCPACGLKLTTFSGGTQRAVRELERTYASYGLREGESLLRVDSDSMRSARDYFRALERFARGEARVMLGTQMIAKGLDFPNVRLVGVIDADTALWLPDFRSAERTFQLVTQVAGRAGRGSTPGRVVVQTVDPGNPAIVAAAGHDFPAFAAHELPLRARFGLPPVTRLTRIVVQDARQDRATELAGRLARELSALATGVEVRGPAPCPIARIAGRFRVSIELVAARAADMRRVLHGARALLRHDRVIVDVDPVSLV